MPTDPTTGLPLPPTTIQRLLFTHQPVHIYGIPPLLSTSGFSASSWTSSRAPTAQKIFTARLRILETSLPEELPSQSQSRNPNQTPNLKSDIILEDPETGDLFAAAPYSSPAVVQQANDTSRFFAVRVVGEGGMKATLGIGFEDRSSAFDFGVALGEVRKVLWGGGNGDGGRGGGAGAGRGQLQKKEKGKLEGDDAKRDFSLKEGEKIVVNVPGRRRQEEQQQQNTAGAAAGDNHGSAEGGENSEAAALFSIARPPPAAGAPSSDSLQMQGHTASVPPPSSPDNTIEGKTAQELGFDDGEFGEFQ